MFLCFVDLKKAFDMVPQSLMWDAYDNAKVPASFTKAVQLMYQFVCICIRTKEGLTDWLLSNLGVRQGCPHSPTAFALFMQKLYEYLQQRVEQLDAPTLQYLVILLLLFVDDVALMSTTKRGLQVQLDTLHRFCVDFHMRLNVDKTVIVIFTNGQKITILQFLWQGQPLKQEDSARYLGMLLFCSQKFHTAKQEKIQSAIRASYNILSKAVNRHLLHTIPIREYFMHYTKTIVCGTHMGGGLQQGGLEANRESANRLL